jgi:peptidoglycan/LPS O-acetylase OafA/YrhL
MADDKNLDIEALRSLAIIMVCAAHMFVVAPAISDWTYNFFLGGGVDLFFCISGFLITSLLLPKITGGVLFRAFVPQFWLRRIFRLWPAAVFWAVFFTTAAALFDHDGRNGPTLGLLQSGLAGALNVANFQVAACAVHVAVWMPCEGFGHYWSLSLEEQFYWIIPVVLFVFRGRAWLIVPFAALAAWQISQVRPYPDILWFLRTEGLLIGVIIALAWHHFGDLMRRMLPWRRRRTMNAIWTAVFVLYILIARPWAFPLFMGVSTAVGGLLVLLASANQRYLTSGRRMQAAVRYLGSRSYSIYLVHLMVFGLFHDVLYWPGLLENSWWPMQALALVGAITVSLAMAEFSYRVIENPLRRFGRAITTRDAQLASPTPASVATASA